MIIKSYQIKNINKNIKYILIYGLNTGAKFEEISKLTSGYNKQNIFNYNEIQILESKENFFSNNDFEPSIKTIKETDNFEEQQVIDHY